MKFVGYKFRLYPTLEQQVYLNQCLGAARWAWNYGLNCKIETYEMGGGWISGREISAEIPRLKEIPEYAWLLETDANSLRVPLDSLESAYKKFVKGKDGKPSFKSKSGHQAFQFWTRDNTIDLERGILKLPKKGGAVKMVVSREVVGFIKHVTISKTPSGKYFASLYVGDNDCHLPPKLHVAVSTTTIGIDVGIKHFATFSTGEKIENPRHLRKAEVKLKRAQRQHAKKKKGSKNKEKSRLRLARCHEKVTNRRKDFHHKLSTKIVHDNQVSAIAIEDLNVAGMMRNHCLARAIGDASWSTFFGMLDYKCGWAGKTLIRIGRFEPSSKTCSCGVINQRLVIADRSWTCAACGITHDRDILAANNIKRFALRDHLGV